MILANTRRWRLASGLIMFVYIALHMINHAIGAWSFSYAEIGLGAAMAIWRNFPGTVLLYGAACVHFALALRTIYERRHWRLPAIEWLRLWAGFSLPWLLIGHVFATRVAGGWYEFETNYHNVVGSLVRGGLEGWQIALLAPGWIHGCLGLWISLRRYALMRKLQPALLLVMIGLPVLSAVGFGAMARAVQTATPPLPTQTSAAQKADLELWRKTSVGLYFLLLIAAAGAGWRRNVREHVSHEAAQRSEALH